MTLAELVKEGARQFTICNACRYCEGYCPVFPAIESRVEFATKDVIYLANLCHDCRACYYACMYVPPHEFAVNVPALLSSVRRETYRTHSFPSFMRRVGRSGAVPLLALLAACSAAILVLVVSFGAPDQLLSRDETGSFYRILPYAAMVTVFLALGGYVLWAVATGASVFWREINGRGLRLRDLPAALSAGRHAATLRHLDDTGDGCFYPNDRPRQMRRTLHHLVFYGFVADFAATVSAALLQDVFDVPPPYPLLSAPVILGSAGGAAIVIGAIGLLALKRRADEAPADPAMSSDDRGLLAVLLIVTVSGFLTLGLRTTALSGASLVLHLGAVAALFLVMPYGKFVHFVYRYGALVRNEIESRPAGRAEP